MRRFWNWLTPEPDSDPDAGSVRVLRISGTIAEESWFDDDITPQLFAAELNAVAGPVTVWLNSPGGDVVAAARIYNVLLDYPGTVTVCVDGIAASAASVIAMAASRVAMTPVSMLMIHNLATMAVGDKTELSRALEMLDSVKESIVNAYQAKTGLSRAKLAKLMDEETWMDARRDVESGCLNSEDDAQYAKMEADIDRLTNEIARSERAQRMDADLARATTQPLTTIPGVTPDVEADAKTGRATGAYKKAFWDVMRLNASPLEVRNALSEGVDSEGGYLVPDEFEHALVSALTDQNVMRSLAKIIQTTSGDRKIPVVSTHGTAAWMDEGKPYTESDEAFTQVSLSAFKLGTFLKVSEELLNDAAFNVEAYLASEFARRIGAAEEEAFLTGDGKGKPTGIFAASGGGEAAVTTGKATDITADELIDLHYSLRAPYRKNAVWLMNDSTVKTVRKLKDTTGQYLWQPALTAGTPDMILGRPVHTSTFVPEIKAGAKTVAFGDLAYYWIADRQGRSFKRLNELFATSGQVGFLAAQRLDGKLILPEAVKVLTQKASA